MANLSKKSNLLLFALAGNRDVVDEKADEIVYSASKEYGHLPLYSDAHYVLVGQNLSARKLFMEAVTYWSERHCLSLVNYFGPQKISAPLMRALVRYTICPRMKIWNHHTKGALTPSDIPRYLANFCYHGKIFDPSKPPTDLENIRMFLIVDPTNRQLLDLNHISSPMPYYTTYHLNVQACLEKHQTSGLDISLLDLHVPDSGKLVDRVEKDEPKVEHKEPKVEHKEPRVEKDEPKVEHKEPRVEKDEPNVEHKEPRVEKDEPKVEHKEPKIHSPFKVYDYKTSHFVTFPSALDFAKKLVPKSEFRTLATEEDALKALSQLTIKGDGEDLFYRFTFYYSEDSSLVVDIAEAKSLSILPPIHDNWRPEHKVKLESSSQKENKKRKKVVHDPTSPSKDNVFTKKAIDVLPEFFRLKAKRKHLDADWCMNFLNISANSYVQLLLHLPKVVELMN